MQDLMRFAAEHGVILVFAGVLVEQLGAPIPSLPLVVVVGAVAADGHFSPWAVLAAAVVASLAGNAVWFVAGRRFGHRVLKTVCRISISPDSCVRQTENFFDHWGAPALVIAKFVPGLSMVAPPLAGAMSMGWGRFLAFNAAGALIWAGAGTAAGLVFHTQVDALLAAVQAVGGWGLLLLAGALAVFIAWKWWERQKVFRTLALARITPEELHRLMDEGHDPVILDVRSRPRQVLDFRRIPGAISVDMTALDQQITQLPRDRDIVVYCACPNEASAAKLAETLLKRGFLRARPLLGGIEAWENAGYTLERGEGGRA